MTSVSRYVASLTEQAAYAKKQISILVDHKGEKGRAAEHIVSGIIRTILPRKFSLGTGFAVSTKDSQSAQLDVVVFDEQLNAPLSLIGGVGVFPIECIYATIEVKSHLDNRELEKTAKSIGQVRRMRPKRYVQEHVFETDTNGNITFRRANLNDPKDDLVIETSPRSYIFAFDTGWSLKTLQQKLLAASRNHGAFFHGVVVLDKEFFVAQLKSDPGEPLRIAADRFEKESGEALKAFAMKLSKDVIRYPMHAANMRRYLGPTEE